MIAYTLSWWLENEHKVPDVSRHLHRTITTKPVPCSFTKVWWKGICYFHMCSPESNIESVGRHAKKFHHWTVLPNTIFNEDMQDMFYSINTVFKLQDWRHKFVDPWCKIWHFCVDTGEIWSSASIAPANNASQKPFSISVALTWQWSTRITLKRIHWVVCVYITDYESWDKIPHNIFCLSNSNSDCIFPFTKFKPSDSQQLFFSWSRWDCTVLPKSALSQERELALTL